MCSYRYYSTIITSTTSTTTSTTTTTTTSTMLLCLLLLRLLLLHLPLLPLLLLLILLIQYSNIGNKVDKESERRVPKSKATQWCKSKGPKPIPYFETSAKESIKVEVAFVEAAQMALHQDTSETDIFIPETINLSKQNQPKSNGNGSNRNKNSSSSGCC